MPLTPTRNFAEINAFFLKVPQTIWIWLRHPPPPPFCDNVQIQADFFLGIASLKITFFLKGKSLHHLDIERLIGGSAYLIL